MMAGTEGCEKKMLYQGSYVSNSTVQDSIVQNGKMPGIALLLLSLYDAETENHVYFSKIYLEIILYVNEQSLDTLAYSY